MALPVRRRGNELRSWDPFQELDDLQHRFSSLLESSFGGLSGSSFGDWTPAVDIEETDDVFVVEAEVPGVKPEDVNVEVIDHELAIHGEIKERERTGILRRQTRRTGRFDYRVVLPRRASLPRQRRVAAPACHRHRPWGDTADPPCPCPNAPAPGRRPMGAVSSAEQ